MRHGKKRRIRRRQCTTRLITRTATFTTTPARATLVRGSVVYATGAARLDRLLLHGRRPLRPGRYTLILRHRQGHRQITTRTQITLD